MSRIERDVLVLNYGSGEVDYGDEYEAEEMVNNGAYEEPLVMPTLNFDEISSPRLGAAPLLQKLVERKEPAHWRNHVLQRGNEDDSPLVMPTINYASEFAQRQQLGSGSGHSKVNNDFDDDDAPLIPPSMF